MTKKLHREILFSQIREIVLKSRQTAFRQVNTLKLITNFLVGKIIVENEQSGEKRANYGKETLKAVSEKLTKEFGRGFSVDNLELFRLFYVNYKSSFIPDVLKSETGYRISESVLISETLSRISSHQPNMLNLSWSHFVLLMKMDASERRFYEIESIINNWSIRELQRQYNSSLYER